MLSLLAAAALLSAPALPARAEDEAAATGDERDTDGDGEVSGKERRQARRAARRARRSREGMTPEEVKAADAADAADAAARSDAASSRAAGAASSLKNMLPSGDGGGLAPGANPGGGGGGSSGSAGGKTGPSATAGGSGTAGTTGSAGQTSGFAAGSSGDPSKPKSLSDYALAAHSGYAPAFTAAGLKLGPDGRSVLRLDGKPATAEDYARLNREISMMPGAVGRRPDFFSVISSEHYSDLKKNYKKDDPVYKDVGKTEDERDLVHTASCSKMSGDCNKAITQDSYKKGDYVAPEALNDMWAALQKELDGSAEQEGDGLPSLGAQRAAIAREKAIEAAQALSGDNPKSETGTSAVSASGPKGETTPVGKAVTTVKNLWKSAASIAFAGAGGPGQGGSNPLPLILGGGAIMLGAGVLFLRRKG